MAHNLVTQVERPGDSAQEKKGLLSSIFCCFSSNNAQGVGPNAGAQTTNYQQQQQQHQQQQQQNQQASVPNINGGVLDPGYNLLPAMEPDVQGKTCLVLDLDETLVHSSFKPVPNADYVVPIEIDGNQHHVYVLKRPHVDAFLKAMKPLFEVVLFTASLSKYADPVTDLLDINRSCRYRLFREHCVFHHGSYVKDLSRLGRDVKKTVIVDNSPASYIFHPNNAIGCTSWFDDKDDRELLDLIPFFEHLATLDDVTGVRPNLQRR